MSKFVAIYHSSAMERMVVEDQDPEVIAASAKAWMDWAERMGSHLTDLGAPLGNPHEVTHMGASEAVEAGSATGYSFLEAGDMAEVTHLMLGHPYLETPGATIQVYEVLPVPGM